MTDWTLLDRELSLWTRDARVLPLWWRDDDATEPTGALDTLGALSRRLSLPVHLAVIPERAVPALARHVAARPFLVPVVHGWRHCNHAPVSQKKAEFGDHRPLVTRMDEATGALTRLRELFGAPVAMFVPPWNRIAPDMAPALAAAGFDSLSTFGPRISALAAPGLAQINTHLDPIDWRGTRGLVDPDLLVAQIARDLADRRQGQRDADEPYGLLTHHLVHDAAIWSFVEALLERLLAGPARGWSAREKDMT